MGQITGQLTSRGGGSESEAAGDVSLGQRIEEEDVRRAPLGAGEKFQLGDELGLKTRCAAGF